MNDNLPYQDMSLRRVPRAVVRTYRIRWRKTEDGTERSGLIDGEPVHERATAECMIEGYVYRQRIPKDGEEDYNPVYRGYTFEVIEYIDGVPTT